MHGRFQPGTQLQVGRFGLYFHHGIYISDARVIQFGSIGDKRGGISAVSLADFERDGTATVVRHGYDSWLTGWHPPADPPWKIVQRAEFLLTLQPRLPYHVIGHNCEIIANMCASGGWTESYQVRRAFSLRAFVDAVLVLTFSGRSRTGQSLPRWVLSTVLAGTLFSVGAKFSYDSHNKRFWDEIREDWQDHERLLADDPRNSLPAVPETRPISK